MEKIFSCDNTLKPVEITCEKQLPGLEKVFVSYRYKGKKVSKKKYLKSLNKMK